MFNIVHWSKYSIYDWTKPIVYVEIKHRVSDIEYKGYNQIQIIKENGLFAKILHWWVVISYGFCNMCSWDKTNLILGEHRATKAALPPTTMLDDLP